MKLNDGCGQALERCYEDKGAETIKDLRLFIEDDIHSAITLLCKQKKKETAEFM